MEINLPDQQIAWRHHENELESGLDDGGVLPEGEQRGLGHEEAGEHDDVANESDKLASLEVDTAETHVSGPVRLRDERV